MSTTTETIDDELELVNIISISELKLINKFSVLNRKLNKHGQIFEEQFSQM